MSNKTGAYCYDCGDGLQYFSLVNATDSVSSDICNKYLAIVANNLVIPYYEKSNIGSPYATIMEYYLSSYNNYSNCTFFLDINPGFSIKNAAPSCKSLGLEEANSQWNILPVTNCSQKFGHPANNMHSYNNKEAFVEVVGAAVIAGAIYLAKEFIHPFAQEVSPKLGNYTAYRIIDALENSRTTTCTCLPSTNNANVNMLHVRIFVILPMFLIANTIHSIFDI